MLHFTSGQDGGQLKETPLTSLLANFQSGAISDVNKHTKNLHLHHILCFLPKVHNSPKILHITTWLTLLSWQLFYIFHLLITYTNLARLKYVLSYVRKRNTIKRKKGYAKIDT